MPTKLIFEYSPALDEMLTEMTLQEFTIKQEQEMLVYKNRLEKEWQKIEKKVIPLIESSSKLKFKADIHCYPVKNMAFRAISSPLIIKQELNVSNAKIIIIHEIIHKLLTQNKEHVANLIGAIYPKKSQEFRIHIPVLTIQKKVMKKLFSEKEVKDFLKKDEDNLTEEWKETNKHFHKFKDNIINYLKDEKLE